MSLALTRPRVSPCHMTRAMAALCATLSACTPHPAEVAVRVPSGAVVLSGTLVLPSGAGPHPGVVIVHGSGSETREAYVPLATVLAERGIAALIYDKRGTGGSTGSWQQSQFGVLADDAAAVLAFLAQRPEIDASRLGVWGGSEGGWIAPVVAARSDRVAIVMVQSAPVVDAARQHLYQVEELVRDAGGNPREVEAALAFVRMQHRFAASGEGWAEYAAQREANRAGLLAMLGGPVEASDWWWAWWRSKLEFDPPRTWARVSVPVLALYGQQDHTVPVEESRHLLAEALRHGGNQEATIMVLPSADHDLAPTGWARVSMVMGNLLRRTPGRTPSMVLMSEWAAERFGQFKE